MPEPGSYVCHHCTTGIETQEKFIKDRVLPLLSMLPVAARLLDSFLARQSWNESMLMDENALPRAENLTGRNGRLLPEQSEEIFLVALDEGADQLTGRAYRVRPFSLKERARNLRRLG